MKTGRSSLALALCLLAIGVLGVTVCSCTNGAQASSTVSSNNVFLTLTADKSTYDLGEKVMITARVKSRSSESVKYEYGEWSEIELGVGPVDGPSEHGACLLEGGGMCNCVFRAIGHVGTLDPGESLVFETSWNQELYILPTSQVMEPAPGEYEITARFDFYEGQDLREITTSVTIEIR